MSERNWSRALWGGLIGLLLGIFLGEHRVAQIAAEQGEAVPTSLNPIAYMGHARFWFVLIVCTVVFAAIVGRVGRPASQSDM